MKPALTAEEWDKADISGWDQRSMAVHNALDMEDPPGFHPAAALALYGQLFGFTREDITGLNRYLWELESASRTLAAQYPETFGGGALAGWPSAVPGGLLGQIEWLRGFIARIEALLPPAPPTEDQ